MENNKKYAIYVNNQKVEVSKEIYQAYWKSVEHERYLIRQIKNTCIYLDHLLDDYERNSVELGTIKDLDPTHNNAIKNIMIEELTTKLSSLSEEERNLIHAVYYDGMSDHEYARKTSQKQTTISKRHRALLRKLRKLLKIWK